MGLGKSVLIGVTSAYNEGFGLAILVYPTEVLQKIELQNRRICLAVV